MIKLKRDGHCSFGAPFNPDCATVSFLSSLWADERDSRIGGYG
jgi:hypothetical protein